MSSYDDDPWSSWPDDLARPTELPKPGSFHEYDPPVVIGDGSAIMLLFICVLVLIALALAGMALS